MVIFDIIVLIFIGLAFYKGFRSGMLQQIASLGAILLGGWLAWLLMPRAATLLNGLCSIPPELLNVVAFLTTFAVITGVLYALAFFLGKILDNIGLGIFNKLAGSAISIFTCLIVVSLLINGIELIDRSGWLMKKETRHSSFFFYPLRGVSTFVFPYVGDMYDEIKKVKEQVSTTVGKVTNGKEKEAARGSKSATKDAQSENNKVKKKE